MKGLLIGLMTLASASAFAQMINPNQVCQGVNEYNQVIETKLFVVKKIDRNLSAAKLVITLEGKTLEVAGTLTNKADLMGVRMFKNSDDSLRYTTAGLIIDADSEALRSNMECNKFRTLFW